MARLGGGYDCEFVEIPPKIIQTECPVCLQILREPYQADCCGYAFCQVCIEQVKLSNKPCPCCKAETFDKFEDKRLKRMLYEFKVYCTNKSQGCKWIGELKQLNSHLNSNPSNEKQLEGCQYTHVKCLHCSKLIQRSAVRIHQSVECHGRPFRCEYCENFDSTYGDVTTNHWPVCGYYPEPCPNNCGRTLQRQGLKNHIANDCPQTLIDCDFKHAGCEERLPRKLMTVHLNKLENIAVHLSQQVAYQRTEMARLENENRKLTQQVAKLTQDLQEMQAKSTLYPVEFTVQNFKKHHDTVNRAWYSPPFYTHQKGYKMSLRIFHSISSGKGIYLTVRIGIVQGEYDEQLEWPFRGEFTVQLLSQKGDRDHDSLTIIAPMVRKKYIFEERMKDGWEASKFIPNSTLQSKYLKDDSIKIRISKIQLWN